MSPEFWRGKRVFLTGHTGFKGGWLSLWLQQLGANVVGYALAPPTERNLFESAAVGRGMASQIADIRDREALLGAITDARPEVVFHLAAQPLVRQSYADPIETYAVNVMGTAHLMEAVRASDSVRAVVNVTTDKCYDNREWIWGYREADPLGGYDPYSSSKACSELVTAAYRQSFFNPSDYRRHRTGIATTRAGNVIGGGDWAEARLVPDALAAFARRRPVTIRNPDAVRPWQHVLEPLSGYLMLAERLATEGENYSEAWNFGPDDVDARPVRWIVDRLAALWGEGASWHYDATEHPHEAQQLRLDCSKAHSRLHWRPRWDLNDALRRTVDWQRAFLAGKDMHALTLAQIAEFTATETH